ncbi:MAG: hypothetical protein ACKVKM_03455 [Verrucomicrobiia bacterium]
MKIATSICLLSALLFVACQAPAIQRAPEFNGDLVAAGHRQIAKAPAHDKNRWRLITAVHALKLGRHSEARALLTTAMPSAGQILQANAHTRLAQSTFSPENVKGFHGESHERAMGWFYHGMFYWMDGEPDNARACFRTAQLMDALAAQPEHRADWVLLDYLDGYITTKLSRDGSDARTRAQANAGDTALPPYNTKANVMIFLQFGFGPMKKTGGDVGEKIVYNGGRSQARSASITVGGRPVIAPIFDNLTFQASTRGDRAMDAILAKKATIKKAGDLVGDIGVTGGAILAERGLGGQNCGRLRRAARGHANVDESPTASQLRRVATAHGHAHGGDRIPRCQRHCLAGSTKKCFSNRTDRPRHGGVRGRLKKEIYESTTHPQRLRDHRRLRHARRTTIGHGQQQQVRGARHARRTNGKMHGDTGNAAGRWTAAGAREHFEPHQQARGLTSELRVQG